MSSIDLIWQELRSLMIARNPDLTDDELQEAFDLIRSDCRFITNLSVEAQRFTVSVEGQAIGFELFYDPLLRCWKATLRDALEDPILADATLLAGVNCVKGLGLRYRGTNDEGEIVEENLVITGLFVTEPRGQKFDKYEQGIESSKFAFTTDNMGNSACAILYFTNELAAEIYATLINGEPRRELVDLDDLDYEIEVK